MSDKLVQQELGVEEGGHLDIVVTEVVDINNFWINVRTTDILGAREKVMDCMDLFYKMKGKDIHVHGEGVNWKCGCCSISGGIPQSKGDQRGQGHHQGQLL